MVLRSTTTPQFLLQCSRGGTFAGPSNGVALERSLNEVVRRHEILRTTFIAIDGTPVQVIAPALTLPVPVVGTCGGYLEMNVNPWRGRWPTKRLTVPST